MYMSNINIPHERNEVEKATHHRKTDDELPCSSRSKSCESKNDNALMLAAKLRKLDAVVYQLDSSEDEKEAVNDSDEDYVARKKPVGGKCYEKVRIYSVSDESCILTDHRMTSICQQSDQFSRHLAKPSKPHFSEK